MKHLSRLLALLLVAALPRLAAADVPPQPIPPLMLGSAWYPEQWAESQWDSDLAHMRKAGLNMVRIGEFAWSSLEPAENMTWTGWSAPWPPPPGTGW
jgi:beta-galactosidase